MTIFTKKFVQSAAVEILKNLVDRITNKDSIAKIVRRHSLLNIGKNQLLVRWSGLRNGLSVKEHCKNYQRKAASQLIRFADYLKTI